MTKGPAYKWTVTAVLLLISALNYGDRAAIASVFPLIRPDLGMTDLDLAAVGACFLWAYAPAASLGGLLADRVSRSWVVVASLAAWSAITLGTGFVTTTHQLLLSRVLLGLAEAACVPAAIGLVADYHDSRTRASAIALLAAGSAVGVVAGGTGLGYLAEHLGWRVGFFILGGSGLLLAVAARLILRDALPPRPGRPPAGPRFGRLAALFRVRSFVLLLVAMLLVAVGNQTFLNWLPLYFRETYGMSLAGAGFAGTFMIQFAAIAGGLLGGIFSDRVAGRNPGRRLSIQIVCSVMAAPFLLVFFSGRPNLALLNGCIFLFSFLLVFGTSNVIPLTCDLLPPNLRGTAIGIGNSANCLAGSAGVVVAGILRPGGGLGGVFGGISGLTLASAVTLLVCHRFFLKGDLARPSGPGQPPV